MDGTELFSECLAQATRVIKQVRPEHMANVTPDNESSVRELLQHMEQLMLGLPATLNGEQQASTEIDEVLEDDYDIAMAWQEAADTAEAEIDAVDVDDSISVAGREMTVDDYLRQIAGDLLIHAWDIGKAIGVPARIDAELAEEVYEHAVSRKEQLRSAGILGTPIAVPESMSIQHKLLALFGRPADWRSPAHGL